jgi:hypothetical protein
MVKEWNAVVLIGKPERIRRRVKVYGVLAANEQEAKDAITSLIHEHLNEPIEIEKVGEAQ